MTVHIYSDSFGFDTQSGTWPFELEKLQQQKVISYGGQGVGPNWSLRKLVENLEDPLFFKPKDAIVIFLSDQKRMEFPWLEIDSHSDGIFLLAEDMSDCPSGLGLQSLKQYETHKSEIKIVANTLGPMFLYENVKNITFLHLLSKNFKKFKFLVFNSFNLNHFTSEYKNFNIKSTKLLDALDFDSLNTPNFYYEPTPMVWSMVRLSTASSFGNHMTVEQNKNFALFCNAILNDEEPDISWFNKDQPARIGNNREEFIYE
jgi:hypothetical protein